MTSNIKHSAFSLAKGRELTGDDFYGVVSSNSITIAIVCDGVGGAEAGAEAAKRATNYLLTNFKIRPKAWSIEKSIKTFITSLNSILYQESIVNYERAELLTTLAIAVVSGNRLYGANVGDSRVYLQRNGILTQLSHDHIQEEGSSVLTEALGAQNSTDFFYFENILNQHDKILLCSDGLYNTIDINNISKHMEMGAHFLVKKASSLANDDLADDTTAIILEILENDERNILKHQQLLIAQDIAQNQTIDGYQIQKALNENTFVASKKTKSYIVKFAPKDALDDEQILDLFVKEAWNAKRLKAPFFPKAVIPKNRTHRYYVMEKLEGITLEEFLQQETLSIDDGVKLAELLLDASQLLLKYDLVHGDIKPHNIIFNKAKNLFSVIDFGSITEIFSISSKAGTPSFLSPERFLNDAISESSEVFSIGVTLYLAFTNRYPYGEIEPFQTPSFKEARAPSFYNNKIPHWLDSVILRSIAPQKERRYAHYSEMLYELKNPIKVVPFFSKDTPLLKKHALTFYKVSFLLSFILNIALLIYLNR